MRRIAAALTSRWVLTAFGVVAAGSMVWLFGPFLSALEGWLPRVVAIGVMTVVWMAANTWISQVRRQADMRLSAGITQGNGGGSARPTAGAEDVAEQRDRLNRAMRLLREARSTRGYLYEQPWYVILGPPGAGKTTALANAGLRFPLAAELQGDEVKGIGGTRYCDWSFTDEAILIDTAGRYTTQDSDAAADKEGWEGFLDLLRRTRPRQPLNGVIVAISVTDITSSPEAERQSHARVIRARIKELYTRLGARIPVYVLFTKLDLIQGFVDFFDDLDKERRAQVWGMTFGLETGHAGPSGAFSGEFRALTARLSDRVVDRLQAERSPERRAAIADFPTQFASLEPPLAAFLDDAFAGTRLEPAPFLRGIYFGSGTQEGNPIDRLTGTLARSFGIDQRQVAPARPTRGRGYFLETLFKQVVFAEAMLLVRNPRAARHRMLARGAAWALAALVTIGGLGALWLIHDHTAARVARFDSGLEAYRKAVDHASPLNTVPAAAADLPRVNPLLDQARALQTLASEGDHGIWDLGLSPRDDLSSAADTVYRGALERILRPRLISMLEARMRSAGDELDSLFRATRVYLILCGEGPMDQAMVKDWMRSDWASEFRGESAAAFRTSLSTHLDALLARPLEPFDVDREMLERSQAKLSQISVGARAYALIRSLPTTPAPRPFVPANEIGAALASKHFTRTGGQLTDPIPGLFTVAGFQAVIVPNMARATDLAVKESWVVGKQSKIDPADLIAREKVEHEVYDLYAKDYRARWDALLATLEMVPPADPASDFSMLTAKGGPMRVLLTKMAPDLELTRAPAATGSGAQAAPPAAALDPSIEALNEHYRELREFVTSDRIDTVVKSVDQLEQQIRASIAASTTASGPALTPGMDPARELSKAASDAPQPVSRWLQTLAQRGGALRDDTIRQQAYAAWSGPGGALALCQREVQLFPFRLGARDDLPLAMFADLFAPSGRLDTFFTQFVRQYVDTSTPGWKLRDPDNPQTPVTAADVAQFQRAQIIRETYFEFGGAQPQIHFALRPLSMDAETQQVAFDFGGFSESWTPTAKGAKAFDWPGPGGMSDVRVTFTPAGTGPDLAQLGPWALFRLLTLGKLERVGAGESFNITLRQGDREARFSLGAGTGHSPFDFDLLTGFRCPALRSS